MVSRNKFMTTAKYYSVQTGKVINENVHEGEELINQMGNASAHLTDYSADYVMTVYKNKQILKESGIFYFRKPKLLRMEVKEGSRKGALAILAKDGKIHGHLGGMNEIF